MINALCGYLDSGPSEFFGVWFFLGFVSLWTAMNADRVFVERRGEKRVPDY